MFCPELLLQKYCNHTHKVAQIHALLITTGFFLRKPSWLRTTTFLYNCLIKSHPKAALHLFTQMLIHSTQPNNHTFPSLLKATSSLSTARSIHAQIIRRGLLLDDFTNCCLVDFYARRGLLSDARQTFEEILHPDITSCNSMLHAFCVNGDLFSALELFERLPERDVIAWTTVINGLAKNGRFREAVEMFRRLMYDNNYYQQVKPNEATFVSLLSACTKLDLRRGKEIHAYITRNENQLTPFVGTALIDFYAKHGLLDSSTILFKSIKGKEVCTWNALISALAGNGKEVEALNLFDEMRADSRLRPNHITFVAVLTACARGRLVDLGLTLFESMSSEFGIVPLMEHYGCIVDLLSRAGLLREAWELVRRMPMEPDASVLGALLGACKVHGDVVMGADVGRRLMALQPRHSGRYMVLSNIYAEAGRWDAAEGLRGEMEKAGVKKIVGYSWLDSGNSVL